jgi:hypothetical protein
MSRRPIIPTLKYGSTGKITVRGGGAGASALTITIQSSLSVRKTGCGRTVPTDGAGTAAGERMPTR